MFDDFFHDFIRTTKLLPAHEVHKCWELLNGIPLSCCSELSPDGEITNCESIPNEISPCRKMS